MSFFFFLAEQLNRFTGFGIGLVRSDPFCKSIIHLSEECFLYRCILRRESSLLCGWAKLANWNSLNPLSPFKVDKLVGDLKTLRADT